MENHTKSFCDILKKNPLEGLADFHPGAFSSQNGCLFHVCAYVIPYMLKVCARFLWGLISASLLPSDNVRWISRVVWELGFTKILRPRDFDLCTLFSHVGWSNSKTKNAHIGCKGNVRLWWTVPGKNICDVCEIAGRSPMCTGKCKPKKPDALFIIMMAQDNTWSPIHKRLVQCYHKPCQSSKVTNPSFSAELLFPHVQFCKTVLRALEDEQTNAEANR